MRVLESMTPEERIATGKKTDEKGSLLGKMQSLVKDLRGLRLAWSDGLEAVVEMLETGRCVVSLD